ncbi:MAG TPA: serine hydrolase domain-containing protein [Pyrinomonadaceae bacterium]|nr:serine hydrolase domain-containing protein [Pyrinomonadaceae bacterium]
MLSPTRAFVILCCLLLLAATAAAAQTTSAAVDFAELEKAVEAELRENKTPGAAFAVVRGERVLFAKGFGATSAEGGASITPDTLFRMGSTTKMFTAAALLTLADAGRIKLDAPIGNYVKNLPPKLGALTAHQLLSQSSGLRDFAPTLVTNDDAGLSTNVRSWKDDVFFTEPNKVYSYSSAGYWLAGLVVEELHGKPYADALTDLLFKPLGMMRSAVRPLAAMTYPLALGHNVERGSATVVRPVFNNAAMYPGGSMYSSANELARFAVALLNGGMLEGRRALAPLVVSQLPAQQFPLPGGEGAFYAYGLLGFETRGIRIVSHGGVSRGYGSTIDFVPAHKLAVVVLANRNGETLPKSRMKALELLLRLAPETNAPTAAPLAVSDTEMRRYTGRYAHAPQVWEVFVKENKLYLKEDGKEFPLTKTGKDKFTYEQGELIFLSNERGEVEHLSLGLYAARKVQP